MKKTMKFIIPIIITIIMITFITCSPSRSSETTASSSDSSVNITSTSEISQTYEIGAIGPGGGIIFYRNLDGFIMTDTGEKAYYLEVAPVDFTGLSWATYEYNPDYGGVYTYKDISDTEHEIGTGRKNTALILALDPDAPAALACKNYSNNGKDDWFLPSLDELSEIYRRRSQVGMGREIHWSSTETEYAIPKNFAYIQNFANGDKLGNFVKRNEYYVRPIRAF